MSRHRLACVAVWSVLAVTLCGLSTDARAQRASVTVIVSGPEATRSELQHAVTRVTGLPIDIRIGELPNAPTVERPSDPALAPRLAEARRRYIDAEFAACSQALADPELMVRTLGAGRRDVAARVQFWRVACLVGAAKLDAAEAAADRFAALGFRLPADVESATPEVEQLIDEARNRARVARAQPVRIEADGATASVSVDGKPRVCAAPCSVELTAGEHVVGLTGDGIVPVSRTVRVADGPVTVRIATTPASPELAAGQWTARYANTSSVDSTPSIRLLSRAIRDRRIVVVTSERLARGRVLRGVLAVDGRVAARSERRGVAAADESLRALMRDLLIRGDLMDAGPPLYRQPKFWVAVGVTALLAATVTTVLVFEREPSTSIGF